MSNAKNHIMIGIIYRPPNGSIVTFNENLNNILSKITAESKQCFIMGDFNIDILKEPSSNFMNTIYSSGFHPLITKPTRVSATSATLIDNIFTNVLQYDACLPGIIATDLTDHFPVFCKSFVHHIKAKKGHKARNYSQKNIDNFIRRVTGVDWSFVQNELDVNNAYDAFCDNLSTLYHECFPFFEVKSNKRKRHPWITNGILKSIKTKNKLFRASLKIPSDYNKSNYRLFRNKLNHVIRVAKKNHFSNKFKDLQHDIKGTWSVINNLLNRGKDHESIVPDSFTHDNNILRDPLTVANGFNEYFVNIGPLLAENIQCNSCANDFLGISNPYSLFLFPVTPDEIVEVASHCLKSNKAAGFDNFKPSVMRNVIHVLAVPLTHIFNISLSHGVFPNRMKVAKVAPVFKKGDPKMFSNYRPISVLPSLSKILERIVYNRLLAFLNKHNILFDGQYGFRAGISTEMALIDAVDKVYDALGKKLTTVGVFLDLSKAFDTIDHEILISKLSHYGIRGTSLSWFKSYIHNRKQFTLFNGESSDLLDIKCGVPQGSILGPLLFILYVNDICNVPTASSLVLFADDTNIFFSGDNPKSLENSIINELDKFYDWFKANKLSLNIDKTNYMVFGKPQQKFNFRICLDGKLINRTDKTKFLGVWIDSKLSWRDHINSISLSVSRSVGILCKLKHFLPKNALRCIYLSLIIPHLTYCLVVWSGTAKSNLNKLVLLQKKAIRHISGSKWRDHTSPLFASLKLLKLPDIVNLSIACFIFRCENSNVPRKFKNLYNHNTQIHDYNTRQSSELHRFPCQNNAQKSLRYRSVIVWNSLPLKSRRFSTINGFKNHLKKYFLR